MNNDDLKMLEDIILKTLLFDNLNNVWFSLDLLQIFSHLQIKKRKDDHDAKRK